MPRLLFEKKGRAIWISHLDLMRVFQRAFKRAGLPLTHTQGFNPRPSVSIALPLSVGVESCCELLDFDLDGYGISEDEIKERLNQSLIDGVRVLDVYTYGRKIRDLCLLRCSIILGYDCPVTDNAHVRIADLFTQSSIMVMKKTKSGIQDQDIIPMIKRINVMRSGNKDILIDCVINCQNPTLNPAQIVLAIEKYLPEFCPDYYKICRLEIFDQYEEIFR